MLDLPRNTAIVLHDAGAANLAIAWIDAGILPDTMVYAEGPAAKLWEEQARPQLMPSLNAALRDAAVLVSGTGWQGRLEHDARAIGRARGIRSVAVLDHWVNYPERFVREGAAILPETLLVADREAAAIAERCFPGIPVVTLPNCYLDRQIAAIAAAGEPAEQNAILAVMEPARTDWGRGESGEFQALDYLVARWSDAGFAPDAPFSLRPHPSEPVGRYAEWLQRTPLMRAEISVGQTLAEDIAQASIVVGLNSYALTIALAVGRSVWSMLPPWAPPCVLPHAGIRHLRSLPAPGS